MDISEHNKKIRQMRLKGELLPLGMTTHSTELKRLKDLREKKKYETTNK